MPRKKAQPLTEVQSMVVFQHEDATYQIDPAHRKVYRRFVEIETSNAAEIISVWRAAAAAATA